MGTRQHRPGVCRHKARRQTEKCRKTTSSSLGFRLCGMQVWRTDQASYITRDKYWGRSLAAESIREGLSYFFNNGHGVRTRTISALVDRLNEMKRTIVETPCQFYAASLLLIYNGLPVSGGSTSIMSSVQDLVDVRIIDFANCVSMHDIEGDAYQGIPESGFAFGLENLILNMQLLLEESTCTCP
eukprot:CAMPEP_0113939372 /NCGR_PEP_ID=MMETSP1339-20121228/5703_1 /TAXON_ID=94617 /ORGANISM="Fibrocapsa japonica" /LENGTH=184 /DNA_ID=CAMNT_0000942863 /DNA_START=446 /DNA_END=1000 /DNA_ORIENTATION=+ /assembly_acc=CAM_ASM_000762